MASKDKLFWHFNLVKMLIMAVVLTSGCAKKEPQGSLQVKEEKRLEKIDTSGHVGYLPVVGAEASSFDITPDWAPEPNPMAPVDGDMLTRWSSNYSEGEQWIYFDLGKNSVVSDVIIRWERAYAASYKILVSKDAEIWQEVYHVKNAEGGTIETMFPPLECRYIKILGLEKANADWGISMWEVEIYGPVSQNEQALITKEEYLARGGEEMKKKKAESLILEKTSSLIPVYQKSFQKGVVYTSWMADELALPASDITLAYLKEIGFDTVAIMVPAYQETLDSEEIFTNDVPGGDTPTIESLAHAVETCHKLGLRVHIKPHLDPRTDEARVNIRPSEKWFENYEKFILKYADFSQKNKVEIFSIGTELEATTFEAWAHRWDRIINGVRAIYSGVITYSANWTEYKEVPFWDKLDFVGIDAYFPLTGRKDPLLPDLIAAWESQANDMENWLKEKGLINKGIIFSEIGYPSADAANTQPWVSVTNVEDQEEQAECFTAVFETFMKRPWFKGYYIWQYFPQDRWSPLGFTVKGKKAEEVIKKWLMV